MRTAKVHGIDAELRDRNTMQIVNELEMGLELQCPVQIFNWDSNDVLASQAKYPLLWQNGDISVQTMANGSKRCTFSTHAQAHIAKDGVDWAALLMHSQIPSLLAPGNVGGKHIKTNLLNMYKVGLTTIYQVAMR